MEKYRISKYDPAFRDKNGLYTKNDWTSFSDVGEKFNKKVLTIDDYLNVEQNYLSFLFDLLKTLKIKNVSLTKQEPEVIFKKKVFSTDDEWLRIIFKQSMRENFWTKFKTEEITIYFGHDLYLHLETPNDINKVLSKLTKKHFLFLETVSNNK